MKNEIIRALLFIAVPMALVQIIYRTIENRFNITKAFCNKRPVLKEKRNLIRAISTLAVILVFGAGYMVLSQFFNVPREAFYIPVGALAGLINGAFITLAYADNR